MKQFSSVVAKIKNSDGVYESIPALRGMSSYEVAKAAGFEGTEREWLEFMFDDGWVAKFQELENKKANKTDVYTRTENLSTNVKDLLKLSGTSTPSDAFLALHETAVTYQEPWNVDENVGQINTFGATRKIRPTGEVLTDIYSDGITMINSGQIYLHFKIVQTTGRSQTHAIKIAINDEVVNTIDTTINNNYQEITLNEPILLTVSKNDIVRIGLSCLGSTAYDISIENIYLFANMTTPYKYVSLIPGGYTYNTYQYTTIIDALLGVTE